MARVAAWLSLQGKENGDKRIALVYYNYPPGKQNIGAAYLNVLPESLYEIVDKLKSEGYDTGTGQLSPDGLFADVHGYGRNIGNWAPAEIDRLAQSGKAVMLPVETYKQWFDALPAGFREAVVKDWGEPETSGINLDKVVVASSTNTIGMLDTDDFFQYLGGTAMAIRAVDGKSPEVFVTNMTNPKKAVQETLEKSMGREMRARYLNPEWIKAMMKETSQDTPEASSAPIPWLFIIGFAVVVGLVAVGFRRGGSTGRFMIQLLLFIILQAGTGFGAPDKGTPEAIVLGEVVGNRGEGTRVY